MLLENSHRILTGLQRISTLFSQKKRYTAVAKEKRRQELWKAGWKTDAER